MTNWSHDAMISAKFITPHSPRMTNWSTTRQINGKLGFLLGAKWFFYKSDRNEQIWCKSPENHMKHFRNNFLPFGKIKMKSNGLAPHCPDVSGGIFWPGVSWLDACVLLLAVRAVRVVRIIIIPPSAASAGRPDFGWRGSFKHSQLF